MVLGEKHQAAIELLVEMQFKSLKKEELAGMLGVSRNTLYRWLEDDDFKAALRAARRAWREQIDHIELVHRRARLEELSRLYRETPDSYISNVIEPKGTRDPDTGLVLRGSVLDPDTGAVLASADGEPVTAIAVRRMNVDSKVKILDQIAQEVGGDMAEELEALKDEVREKLKVVGIATGAA